MICPQYYKLQDYKEEKYQIASTLALFLPLNTLISYCSMDTDWAVVQSFMFFGCINLFHSSTVTFLMY